MVYQLPNGRVVYITLERYLRMSEDEVRDMVNSGEGFTGVKERSFADDSVDEDYEISGGEEVEELGMDIIPDEDDTDISGTQLRIRDIKFGTGDIETE